MPTSLKKKNIIKEDFHFLSLQNFYNILSYHIKFINDNFIYKTNKKWNQYKLQ